MTAEFSDSFSSTSTCTLLSPLSSTHIDSFDGDSRGERIAAVGGTVLAGLDRQHDRVIGKHRRHGIDSARERLAQHHHVWANILIMMAEESAVYYGRRDVLLTCPFDRDPSELRP